jgi:hypothetical protein
MIGDMLFNLRLEMGSSYCSIDWRELEACIENAMQSPIHGIQRVLPGDEEDPIRIAM